jgi:adenosyl cobinamide kinase/adenosyl cobinamide phosphate guanylyltransferase
VRTDPTVIVTEEVGLAIHAATPVGRQFTDRLGELNTAVAAIADSVLLVVAGRVLRLEPADSIIETG